MSVGLLAGCDSGTNSYPNDYNLTYRTSYYNMEKGSYHYSESYEYHFNFSNFVLLDCSKYQKNIASFDSLLACDSYTGHSPIYVEKDGQYMNDFSGAYLAKQFDAVDIKFIDLADDEHEQDEDDLINMIFFHNEFIIFFNHFCIFH